MKFLPINVLIANFVEPLPRYSASLLLSALTGEPLKSGGGVAHGLAFGFLQARLSRRGRRACLSSIVVSGRCCRPILVDFADKGSNL